MSEIIEEDTRITVKPGQDVIASMAQNFRNELRELIKKGARELVIDIADMKRIDPIGMSIIIATLNSMNKVGGKLVITNAEKDICNLLKIMQLDQHITVISA